MELKKKRWLILAASCLVNLCIGSTYAWSVFAVPMAEYLTEITGAQLSAGDLSMAFTLATALGPITMISGGWFNDRIGPRWVVFLGGLFFGLGVLLSAAAVTPFRIILTYGLGCGLGMGLVYGCTISNSVKFFPDRKGLVGGIATASYGLSSVIIPPIASWLILRYGITAAFRISGTAYLLIICMSAFFIQKCPEGFMAEAVLSENGSKSSGVDKNWRQMLGSLKFYKMLLLLCCGAFSGLMITSQAASMGQHMIGMTAKAAASAVSILALFNAAGRVLAGHISDRAGRVNTLTAMCLLSLAGLASLYSSGSGEMVLFLTGLSIMGFCFGSFMGIFPGFTAEQFGVKNNSVNYGIMFIGFSLAGILGPGTAARIYAAAGDYNPAFLIAVLFAALGFVLTLLCRETRRKDEKQMYLERCD